MYKQIIDPRTNSIVENSILRIADTAYIPFNLENTDYQQYLAWIAEGNTPEPADEPSA